MARFSVCLRLVEVAWDDGDTMSRNELTRLRAALIDIADGRLSVADATAARSWAKTGCICKPEGL